MLTKKQAVRAIEKHGSAAAAARAHGVARSTFRHWQDGAAVKPKPSAGKSLDEFRAAHDKSFIVPNRINDALKALGNGWEYEAQFARLAGVSLSDLSAVRDQYAEHLIVLNRDHRRAWAGTKEVAKKMREMIGIL